MKHTLSKLTITTALLSAFTLSTNGAERTVGNSPWGPDDEIGRLNLITEHRVAPSSPGYLVATPTTYQSIILSACRAGRLRVTRTIASG